MAHNSNPSVPEDHRHNSQFMKFMSFWMFDVLLCSELALRSNEIWIGWVGHATHWREEKCTQKFGRKTWRKPKHSWFQTFAVSRMLYAFFWVIPRRLNFICRRFGTLCSIFFYTHLPAYEDGTDSVFRNVGI